MSFSFSSYFSFFQSAQDRSLNWQAIDKAPETKNNLTVGLES